jgi:predicted phage tail protein
LLLETPLQAYPIMQCSLFISGIWGVFVFKEIVGWRAILVFFLSGGVLLGGAAQLGAFGPAPPVLANTTNSSNATNNTNLSNSTFL